MSIHLDLGEKAVTSHLMADPELFGLASLLAKVEHWVFDRADLDWAQRSVREQRLHEASAILASGVKRLNAGEDLIDFMCSISSRRRFVLAWYLEQVHPALLFDLAEYAFARRHKQANCAHYIHWLDIVNKSQLIARVFSQDNVDAVNALLARVKH